MWSRTIRLRRSVIILPWARRPTLCLICHFIVVYYHWWFFIISSEFDFFGLKIFLRVHSIKIFLLDLLEILHKFGRRLVSNRYDLILKLGSLTCARCPRGRTVLLMNDMLERQVGESLQLLRVLLWLVFLLTDEIVQWDYLVLLLLHNSYHLV